jgi:hypothetical protein
MSKAHKDSVNDRMVKRTALPTIYLFIAASGTVIFYGIFKPDIVLPNVEAFIALIMIIGVEAKDAYKNILELWKHEQQVETELHPDVVKSNQKVMEAKAEHDRILAIKQLEHEHALALKQQQHEHCLAHEKQQSELKVIEHARPAEK